MSVQDRENHACGARVHALADDFYEQEVVKVCSVAKAQLKPEIPAHGTTDDCAWEAMTVIQRFRILHHTSLRDHP